MWISIGLQIVRLNWGREASPEHTLSMKPQNQIIWLTFYSLSIFNCDAVASPSTVDAAAEAGANVIVAGSAVFLKNVEGKKIDPSVEERSKVIKYLRDSVVAAGHVSA